MGSIPGRHRLHNLEFEIECVHPADSYKILHEFYQDGHDPICPILMTHANDGGYQRVKQSKLSFDIKFHPFKSDTIELS